MAQNSSDIHKYEHGRGLSLRARVTLWIVIAFAIVKVTLVLLILLYQQRAIHRAFDSAFADRVTIVSQDLSSRSGDIDETYLRGIALRETNNLYIQDFGILLFDPVSMQQIASYGEYTRILRDLAAERAGLQSGVSVYASYESELGTPMRAAILKINLTGDRVAVLVMATSDRYTSSLTRTVGRVLLLSTPFTIGVIAFVAWFVGRSNRCVRSPRISGPKGSYSQSTSTIRGARSQNSVNSSTAR